MKMGMTLLFLALGTAPVRADNIVDNWDFQDGFECWDTSSWGCGKFTCEILNEYEGYRGVLHLKRTDSYADGGGLTISQKFSEDPWNCVADSMIISVRCKIVSHTLTNSGWWSTYYGGYGEFPFRFDVYSSVRPVWSRGILTRKNTEPLTNYEIVPLGEWVEGTLKVDRVGHSLTGLAVCSQGWDWDVYLDYVKIEPIPGEWW